MRVLLLHALPFGGTMWREELDLLPAGTLAPTVYGLDGDTLEAWAGGVLDLAGSDPLIVIGCSLGGSLALEVARAAPQQVMGLVLVGAKAGVRPEPAFRDEVVGVLTEGGMAAAWAAYWEPLFSSDVDRERIEWARQLALAQDVDGVIRGVRAFHDRRDLTDVAAAWTKPLVVIGGDRDRTPPPSVAAALGRGPRRRAHLVKDSGHYVNIERPMELRTLLASTIEEIERSAAQPG